MAKAEKERQEAEEAEDRARKERAEANEAMAIAAKERAEYEAAKREMEREKAEYEEAQRVAQKERREAVVARQRMEERKALHSVAECILASHAARDVANRAIQIVPDDHATLEEAIEQAHSEWREGATGGARILVRRGRHALCIDDDEGELEVGGEGMRLEIIGEEGACVRGTLVLERGGGTIEGVHVESATGSCVWLSDGAWKLSKCALVAKRCYSTALLASGAGSIELRACQLGGSGVMDAAQTDAGGSSVARHAVCAQGRARVRVESCELRHCDVSAVCLQHHSQVAMHSCRITLSAAALQYRVNAREDSVRLTLHDSLVDCSRVWHDDARPFAVEDCRNTIVFFTSSAQGRRVEDFSLCTYT